MCHISAAGILVQWIENFKASSLGYVEKLIEKKMEHPYGKQYDQEGNPRANMTMRDYRNLPC